MTLTHLHLINIFNWIILHRTSTVPEPCFSTFESLDGRGSYQSQSSDNEWNCEDLETETFHVNGESSNKPLVIYYNEVPFHEYNNQNLTDLNETDFTENGHKKQYSENNNLFGSCVKTLVDQYSDKHTQNECIDNFTNLPKNNEESNCSVPMLHANLTKSNDHNNYANNVLTASNLNGSQEIIKEEITIEELDDKDLHLPEVDDEKQESKHFTIFYVEKNSSNTDRDSISEEEEFFDALNQEKPDKLNKNQDHYTTTFKNMIFIFETFKESLKKETKDNAGSISKNIHKTWTELSYQLSKAGKEGEGEQDNQLESQINTQHRKLIDHYNNSLLPFDTINAANNNLIKNLQSLIKNAPKNTNKAYNQQLQKFKNLFCDKRIDLQKNLKNEDFKGTYPKLSGFLGVDYKQNFTIETFKAAYSEVITNFYSTAEDFSKGNANFADIILLGVDAFLNDFKCAVEDAVIQNLEEIAIHMDQLFNDKEIEKIAKDIFNEEERLKEENRINEEKRLQEEKRLKEEKRLQDEKRLKEEEERLKEEEERKRQEDERKRKEDEEKKKEATKPEPKNNDKEKDNRPGNYSTTQKVFICTGIVAAVVAGASGLIYFLIKKNTF